MISSDAKSAFLKIIGGVSNASVPRSYYIALATDVNQATGKFTEVSYETLNDGETGYKRYYITGRVEYANNAVTNSETLYFSEALVNWEAVRYFALVADNNLVTLAAGIKDYSNKTAIAWGEITDQYGNPLTLEIKKEQLPIIRQHQLQITLKEVERKKYNVEFNQNGGTGATNMSNLYCIPGGIVSVKPGFVFDDWYLDSDFQNHAIPGTELVANTTLFANWLTACTVSFSIDNKIVTTRTVGYGRTVVGFEPTKEDHTFVGWYTDPDFATGTLFDFNTPITANITLYAKFVEITE